MYTVYQIDTDFSSYHRQIGRNHSDLLAENLCNELVDIYQGIFILCLLIERTAYYI